jgi:hypothetical protein
LGDHPMCAMVPSAAARTSNVPPKSVPLWKARFLVMGWMRHP